MINSQPLVFAYFQLPHSHQSFSQIREILWSVFVPQLENLSSALEKAQAIHPSPNATKILREARYAAVDEIDKLWDYFQIVEGVALRYLGFLDCLLQNNLEEERYAYRSVCLLARASKTDSGKAQQIMANVREGIENAISRIISLMAGGGRDLLSFINESSKVLAEIGSATDVCYELLSECREYFAKLEQFDFDEESFLRDPAWEEFQVVQQKWREFFKIVGSLWVGWSELKNGIRGERRRFDSLDNTSGEEPRNHTTTNNPLRDMRNPNNSSRFMGRNTPASATLPHELVSNKAKIPFWRKTLRCLVPCLSVKSFC